MAPSKIAVRWSAADEDGTVFRANQQTAFDSWADCKENADGVVHDICLLAFPDGVPEEVGGDDIVLIIHEPPSIAGTYNVELSQVVQPNVRRRT